MMVRRGGYDPFRSVCMYLSCLCLLPLEGLLQGGALAGGRSGSVEESKRKARAEAMAKAINARMLNAGGDPK